MQSVNDHPHRTAYMSLMMALVALFLHSIAVAEPLEHEPFEPPRGKMFGPAENVFLHAKTSGSIPLANHPAILAVDGIEFNHESFWASRGLPAHLTLDLEEPKPLNMICIWLNWDRDAFYQYMIEGSLDGRTWNLLVDQRRNTERATELGECFYFPEQTVHYVRVTFESMSVISDVSGCIVEIMGFNASQQCVGQWRAWMQVPKDLNSTVASIDERYDRETVPTLAKQTMQWADTAWRGERVNAQFLLWSHGRVRGVRLKSTSLQDEEGHEIPVSCVKPSYVRYVLGDGKLSPDVLDDRSNSIPMKPFTVRPIWATIDVPADTPPGIYKGQVIVTARGGIKRSFDLSLEVLPLVLAPPGQWPFHLDLWQNPWSVARYHHVEPWSDEHISLLKPHLKMLANAGQKCITTTILERPWRGQTYDTYGSMIKWTKQEVDQQGGAQWKFDFSRFDRYVELCDSCGITKQINCYTMVPWGDRLPYFDEKMNQFEVLEADPKKIAYREHWRPFLEDFVPHLRERGWLDRTVIAIDERSFGATRRLIEFLQKKTPDLKVALAGQYYKKIKFNVHDYSFSLFHAVRREEILGRTAKGLPTTFYVCCNPPAPNTFVYSPPAESTWMGWFAAAQGYSGFLRWAYNSWVHDPLYDTSHVSWSAGDCFLIYPGPRSSIRFERLRDGIEDYEKIQTLRKILKNVDDAKAKECLQALEQTLGTFAFSRKGDRDYTGLVRKARATLEQISRDTVKYISN